MDEVALNHCLHCGGDPKIEITNRPNTVRIFCQSCGTQTRVFEESIYYSAIQEAANIWNANANQWVEWIQPTGAHDAYAKNARVLHNNIKWVSLVDANVWEPGVSGWELHS